MAENNSIMDMVRRFAGADPAEEDTVLQMCYRAAVAWYEAAGVHEDPEDELWLFWVCNLAAWMYDNRGNADPNAAVPVYIVTSVHQLRKPAGSASSSTNSGNSGSSGTGSAEGAGDAEGSGSAGDGESSEVAGE